MGKNKYCILLFGKNKSIVKDFFLYHGEGLECLSSNLFKEDLGNHLRLYKPDAMVFCMNEEEPEQINQIFKAREEQAEDVPMIVIGQPKECDALQANSIRPPELFLRRPMSFNQIEESIIRFLNIKKERDIKQEADRLIMERKHILVVDDDPLMLKVMKENLREGYEVATAISGKVAMKYLSNKKVDLIFLDYQMPDVSGVEVMEQLQKNEATKDIPVIFLTGVKEKDKIQKALKLKPNGYLLKPIEREQLIDILQKHFMMCDDEMREDTGEWTNNCI